MLNKLILWSLMILPWFTLFLMKKEEIKQYLPVGIFAALTSIIVVDIGSTLNLWTLHENIYPFNKVFPYHLGAVPVVTMWLFKFTYGKFLRYIIADAIYNLIFAFLFSPWMSARGIRENIQLTDLGLFIIVTIHGIFLYLYQILQGSPFGHNSSEQRVEAAKIHEKNNRKLK